MRTPDTQLRRSRRPRRSEILFLLAPVLAACGFFGLLNEGSGAPTATPRMAVCLPPKELASAIAGMEIAGGLWEDQGTPGAMETMRAFMTQFPPDEPTCAPGQIPFPSATPDLRTPKVIFYEEDGTAPPPFLAPAAGANATMESVKLTLEAEATAGGH